MMFAKVLATLRLFWYDMFWVLCGPFYYFESNKSYIITFYL